MTTKGHYSDPLPRFEAKINRDGPIPVHRPDLGPCWLWTGSVSGGDNRGNGYARFLVERRFVAVHRWAYAEWVGPIPDGLELDHLCRNRRCVNPAHLEPVTHRENQLRGATFGARLAVVTHCPQGHPYDEGNTYVRHRRGQINRDCRTCLRARALAWQAAKRLAAKGSR